MVEAGGEGGDAAAPAAAIGFAAERPATRRRDVDRRQQRSGAARAASGRPRCPADAGSVACSPHAGERRAGSDGRDGASSPVRGDPHGQLRSPRVRSGEDSVGHRRRARQAAGSGRPPRNIATMVSGRAAIVAASAGITVLRSVPCSSVSGPLPVGERCRQPVDYRGEGRRLPRRRAGEFDLTVGAVADPVGRDRRRDRRRATSRTPRDRDRPSRIAARDGQTARRRTACAAIGFGHARPIAKPPRRRRARRPARS